MSMFRKAIQYGGITLEYSGSDAAVERVNSSKPLKKDLVVEVRIQSYANAIKWPRVFIYILLIPKNIDIWLKTFSKTKHVIKSMTFYFNF